MEALISFRTQNFRWSNRRRCAPPVRGPYPPLCRSSSAPASKNPKPARLRPPPTAAAGEGGGRAAVQAGLRLHAGGPAAGDRRTGRADPRGGEDPGAARRHWLGQDLHRRPGDRDAAAPGAGACPEQDPGRPALRGVQELLPRQCGRVLRLLLRLLPARGLRPPLRHLYREGKLGERGDRPDAPFGDALFCSSGTT